MRQTAGTLNRTWLAILGVLSLTAGILALLQATGILQTFVNTPSADTKLVTGDLHAFFAHQWLVILFLVIAGVIGVLALLWMIAQIPVKNRAETYRLHRPGMQGRTTCDPSVIAGAVEHQVTALPDVVTASVLLRGTADEPDLTLKVTINDQADVRGLLRHLEKVIFPELSNSLGAPLQTRRVQIDVTERKQSSGTMASSTGIVLH